MNYDDEYTDFDNQVIVDGYKKLKNVQQTVGATCICIGSCLLIAITTARRLTLAHARKR